MSFERILLKVFWLAIALGAAPACAQTRLTSPDGTISVELASDAVGRPRYTVYRRGEPVLAPSPLGFHFSDQSATGRLDVREISRSSIDETVPVVAGKTARARNRYTQLVVALDDPARVMPTITLTFRAFDDGVAFRYRIAGSGKPLSIWNEQTGFYLPAPAPCWGSNVGSFTSSHESEFDRFDPARVRVFQLYDTGVLCKSASGATSLLFAEADLRDYAGLYLRGREDGGIGFDTALATLPGERRAAVRLAAGEERDTPWRVVLMADRAGDLIASNTIGNLNPPPAGDWTWVRPGKAAWDWWSGPYFADIPAEPMNQRGLERLIDFAGASGLQYMLIDEGWALRSGVGGSAPADTDITRTQPWLDLPVLAARARARGVGLMLWLQWSQLDARLDEALDQYVRWGVKGIKVDFMDRNDADMVAYYHRVLAAAAKHHLLVDLHGAYQPTGLSRTYPNYITQEGVLGAEFNKWSKRVTATHNVALAFTRLPLGPMDYTPGGFRNRTPADFRIVGVPPQVQTTRGAALAMYVVYESPLQMVSDSPDAYFAQPEFAFLRDVPTTWDETRFLGGDIDSFVAVARRKGTRWYVGAMTNEQARPVTIPLGFLGPGRYAATSWQDGARADQVVRGDRTVAAGDTVTLSLAGSGGAAMVLEPQR